MSGIDPGRLNKRVTIEEKTETPNGQGGFDTAWAAVATDPDIWAEIVGLSGDEALQAGIERSVQQWRVTIRRRAITAKNRLDFKGSKFDIKSALPDPRADDAIVLICETTGVVIV
jgi:SPP1 family predicted phage head-tail adaptor